MPRSLTEQPINQVNWIAIFRVCAETYLWLSTWAERHVETDEDGQHLPQNVRRILKNHTYYI